jgi:hypothetical protein
MDSDHNETQTSSKETRDEEFRRIRKKGPLAAQFEDCGQHMRKLYAAMDADPEVSEKSAIYGLAERCHSGLISWGHDSGASSRILDHTLRRSLRPRENTERLLTELQDNITHGKSF